MKEIKRIQNQAQENLFVETYTPDNSAKGTMVLCHGITGCRKGRHMNDDYFQTFADMMCARGFKVVLFDFSGHGESEGDSVDVCISKNTSELEIVMSAEVDTSKPVYFLAFSYGAAILCNYLKKNPQIDPAKIVFYSPCLYPLESCFLNKKSIFGCDVCKAYYSGQMVEQGFALVGAKGFKLGINIINECKTFMPDCLGKYSDRILAISGEDDVILDTSYNVDFFERFNIKNIWLKASHSLFEAIDDAFAHTIEHFEA